MRPVMYQLLILALVFISVAESLRTGGGKQGGSARTGYPIGAAGGGAPNVSPATPQTPPSAKLVQQTSRGIGAWGYIAIILTVIISGMGAYYFVILYPIVCKKERMYDVMEMTTV